MANILVVDDEPVVLTCLGMMLEEDNHTIVKAKDGQEGLEVINGEQTIDLLISDNVMPIMLGPELIRRAYEQRPELPVMFCTSHLYEDGFLNFGILTRDHLNKPFNMRDLLASVDLHLYHTHDTDIDQVIQGLDTAKKAEQPREDIITGYNDTANVYIFKQIQEAKTAYETLKKASPAIADSGYDQALAALDDAFAQFSNQTKGKEPISPQLRDQAYGLMRDYVNAFNSFEPDGYTAYETRQSQSRLLTAVKNIVQTVRLLDAEYKAA